MIDYGALDRTVVIGNGKGGVGKTAIAANVAGLAARSGYPVLLIDLDPQGNIRDELGIRGSEVDDDGAGLAQTLMSGQPLTVTAPQARQNLDVIIGGRALSDVAAVISGRIAAGRHDGNTLAGPLAAYLSGTGYDLVVIDSPPGEAALQQAALEAARWLVIPTQSDTASLQGMGEIAEQMVRAGETNPALELLGVALFNESVAATALRRDVTADITTMLGDIAPMFSTIIRTSVAGKKARRDGQLVHEYSEKLTGEAPWKALREGRKPANPGTAPALAADYLALTNEILTQIADREKEAVNA
ncbi:cellulose biosynthesis protein BcsQ [Antricoccus suffuscus]|uniref:Cellulose biosynthesis protein BcsQ n=1 Tax=Antricoccus suffuscus TaxID=1629062 RepID=A0A2T0ZTQ2_9ACTN|nr:ParA family protein [Antricoccus suffuscus]PRZ39664.1 cellulose biosynthesis protein BcsQ [Antricoccus suffuscus]